MGWPSEARNPNLPVVDLCWSTGACLIIAHPAGIQYTNQVGGVACLHPCLEGFLVPLERDESDPGALQRKLAELFDGPVWKGSGARGGGIGDDDAAYIDALLSPCFAWETLVDRDRLLDSDEAWVWMTLRPSAHEKDYPLISGVTGTMTGVLTWTNSD